MKKRNTKYLRKEKGEDLLRKPKSDVTDYFIESVYKVLTKRPAKSQPELLSFSNHGEKGFPEPILNEGSCDLLKTR